MLYSSSRLRGLSRHYYETHQRHHIECGLVPSPIAGCPMNNLLNCLCKVLQSYSLRTLLIPQLSIDQTWWAPRGKNMSDHCESQGQVRGEPSFLLWVWSIWLGGADILIKERAQSVTTARAMSNFSEIKPAFVFPKRRTTMWVTLAADIWPCLP